MDHLISDDDFGIPIHKSTTVVCIWKDCRAKGHIVVDWLRVLLPWSILIQMIILNNLVDSIVLNQKYRIPNYHVVLSTISSIV
jgi:hypothetical protein